MNFDDTPEEAAFRKAARAWLEANAEPLAPGESPPSPMEWHGRPDGIDEARAWMARKADARWACLTWPEEFGGRGASRLEALIWEQEEKRFAVPPNLFTIGQGMLGPTLMVHGSERQKERYLGPMLRADEVWCQLFSEPGAGSDLAGLGTRAVREGDEWIVNGQKIWTSGAHYSDFGMLLTRTDPDRPKHEGITYFIIDMRWPGIEIRPIRQMNGAANFNEVFFNDLRIPDANRIGEIGTGWKGALTTLMNERQTLSVGAAGPGFEDLLALARRSRRRGRPAIEDASVRSRLADFYIRQTGLQYTRYRTLSALARGATPGPESSIGKVVSAPLRQAMASFALDLMGVAGVARDATKPEPGSVFQSSYLAAPGGRLAGGTDEVLRNVLAERVLGLPAEPRADKGIAFSEIPSGSGSPRGSAGKP
jgi:acyl-CoA dehydrogenase